MIQSKTLKALAFAVAGSALALGGCGSDDGGGGTSVQQPGYTGTGAEALGWYVGEVTASTGIYADAGRYAPAGMTRHLNLYLSGDSLYLDYNQDLSYDDYDGDVELIADPATQTYGGSTSWDPDHGFLEAETIEEYWTVSFAGDTVTLTVDGQGPTSADVGTITFVLRPLAVAPSLSGYGQVTSHGDARSVGQSTYQSLYQASSSDGAEGYIYTDATYQWSDYFWAPLYRAGNTLRGGQHAATGYQDDDADGFATLVFTLDALDKPVSTQVNVADYNNLDDDGHRDTTEPASWSVTASYRPYEIYAATYDSSPAYDLTITSVTAGGQLETAVGAEGDVLVDFLNCYPYGDNAGVYFNPWGMGFWGGYVSSTKRELVAWDGRYYDYYNDTIGYDIDGYVQTEERMTLTLTYDDTTLPAIPVSGAIKLQVYNWQGSLLSTEDLTFTLANGAYAP